MNYRVFALAVREWRFARSRKLRLTVILNYTTTLLLQQFFFASNILQTNHFLSYSRLSAITLLLRIRYYGPTMVVRPHKLLEMLRKSNHYLQYWITQKTSKRNERTYSWCENQTLLPDSPEKYITANRERCESNYGRFRITRDTPYFYCLSTVVFALMRSQGKKFSINLRKL